MILKDFEQGGFPINKKCPVICTSSSGSVEVAYNSFDLKTILNKKQTVTCLGVWPGKKDTDCFLLDTNYYGEFAPPVEYKDIESASKIEVFMDSKGNFVKLIYSLPEASPVTCTNIALYDFIKKHGTKHLITRI